MWLDVLGWKQPKRRKKKKRNIDTEYLREKESYNRHKSCLAFNPDLWSDWPNKLPKENEAMIEVNPAYTGSESVVNGKLELFRIPPTDVSASSDRMVPIEPVPHPSTQSIIPFTIKVVAITPWCIWVIERKEKTCQTFLNIFLNTTKYRTIIRQVKC